MNDIREAFELYAASGPVGYHSTQRKMGRLWIVLRPHFTIAERRQIMAAREHASTGEGRAEFDRVMAQIRARLFPAQK